MRRAGYHFLGFLVWKLVVGFIRLRYPGAPKKLAIGTGVVAALAAAVLVLRRGGDSDF